MGMPVEINFFSVLTFPSSQMVKADGLTPEEKLFPGTT
jgi:hypothetical protein